MKADAQIVRAPKTATCCSKCGRMAGVFRKPRTLEEGVQVALGRREGSEVEIRTRIRDMLESGLLREV